MKMKDVNIAHDLNAWEKREWTKVLNYWLTAQVRNKLRNSSGRVTSDYYIIYVNKNMMMKGEKRSINARTKKAKLQ